jgi:uncharacterized protein YlxW (UPF0749 family)
MKVLLPPDLRKRVENELKRRLSTFKLVPAVDYYPPVKNPKFKDEVSIRVAMPHKLKSNSKSATIAEVRELYAVKGPALWHRVRFRPEDLKYPDTRRDRYEKLGQEISLREKNKAFLKLAYQHTVLEEKEFYLSEEREIVKELEQMLNHMGLEKTYLQGINQLMETAVAEVTGITTLEGVMKGLINILVVDDLGDRTLNGLADLGYKRKYLAGLRYRELMERYREFAQTRPDKPELTHFIAASEAFKEHDLFLINQWDASQGGLMVKLGIRKKSILSKKEEALLRKKNTLEEDIGRIQGEREDLKNRLRKTIEEIKEIEDLDPDTIDSPTEKKYQRLLKVQKRLVADLKRKTLKIKELQRPVNDDDQLEFREINFYSLYEAEQGLQQWMSSRVANLKSGNLFGGPKKRTDIDRLQDLGEITKHRRKAEANLQRLQQNVTQLQEQLAAFATESGFATAKKSYAEALDGHILDKLEYVFLGGLLAQEVALAMKQEGAAATNPEVTTPPEPAPTTAPEQAEAQ